MPVPAPDYRRSRNETLAARHQNFLPPIPEYLLFALGWIALIGVTSVALAAVVMLFVGLGSGYQMITFFTALQRRVPRHLLGRLMSLVLLFNVGLTPLSQALAGVVIRWSLTGLFGPTGVLFFLLITWASFQPGFQMVGEILATRQS